MHAAFDVDPETKYILKVFKLDETFWTQKQSCITQKAGQQKCFCLLILLVLKDAILLSLTLEKRTSVNFFKVSNLLPNIFAPYIKKMWMPLAILVHFDFG